MRTTILIILLLFAFVIYYLFTLDRWADSIIAEDAPKGYMTKQGIEKLTKIYGNLYWDGKRWRRK